MKSQILLRTALIAVAGLALSNFAFAADAAANWKGKCAVCHNADGAGKKALGTKDMTAADTQAALTDEAITKALNEGVATGKVKMASFKDKLSADEIKDLVAYIRALKK